MKQTGQIGSSKSYSGLTLQFSPTSINVIMTFNMTSVIFK